MKRIVSWFLFLSNGGKRCMSKHLGLFRDEEKRFSNFSTWLTWGITDAVSIKSSRSDSCRIMHWINRFYHTTWYICQWSNYDSKNRSWVEQIIKHWQWNYFCKPRQKNASYQLNSSALSYKHVTSVTYSRKNKECPLQLNPRAVIWFLFRANLFWYDHKI